LIINYLISSLFLMANTHRIALHWLANGHEKRINDFVIRHTD